MSKTIVHNTIVPFIKQNNISGALVAGTTAITNYVDTHENEIASLKAPMPSGEKFFWVSFLALIIGTVGCFGLFGYFKQRKPVPKNSIKQSNMNLNKHYPYTHDSSNQDMDYRHYSDDDKSYKTNTNNDFLAYQLIESERNEEPVKSDNTDFSFGGPSTDVSSSDGFTSDNEDRDNYLGGGADELC